ncbi:MAG TPA: SRPBCC domain-containing protein [Gemmatimonadaceae bacterium]|nr:SRPBCC domain-containing protein [Gemmatimonadaceae bacterium]
MSRRIVEQIDIAAPPSRVFEALTDPVQLLAWWGDRQTFPSTHWELDARVGGKWISRWRDPDGNSFALGGVILEIDPPRLLVYSWWDDRFPGLPLTTVRYELAPTSTGTLVTVTHDGFDDVRADFVDYNGGWSNVMRSLRAHAESGHAFRANHDIAIEVESLVDAEAFYGGTLGFSIRSRTAEQLEIDARGLTLWVNRVVSRDARRSFIPSFDVPDASKARAALEDAGCRVVRAGESGFYFEDPFGFTIDIVERRT